MVFDNNIYPFISIIIPTRDNDSDLIDCLESIQALDCPSERIEIIIWDNNSSNDSKSRVLNYLKTSRLNSITDFIEHDDNYGVYTSRDELFNKISQKSDFALSIDDDVILPPLLLQNFITHFQKNHSLGIIGARTVYDDDPSQTAHGAGIINWWKGQYLDIDTQIAIECDYVIGCCMLIKKEVIDTIGGFGRDYYTSHGEVDYCLKAKKRGFTILYCPEVIVRHRVDKGGTRTLERMYYIFRNKLMVIKKNAPLPHKWFLLILYSILWLPKSILDSIRINKRVNIPEIKTIAKAIWDAWLGRVGKRV